MLELISAVDSLCTVFYTPEGGKQAVSISIPLSYTTGNPKDPVFAYEDIVDAFLSGERILHGKLIDAIAPDVTLAHLPILNNIVIVGEKIGEGGFGWVYRGSMGYEEREVAIKEFKAPQDVQLLTTHFKDFHAEIFLMSTLQHENLVKLYGIMSNPLRMVMEYVFKIFVFFFFLIIVFF